MSQSERPALINSIVAAIAIVQAQHFHADTFTLLLSVNEERIPLSLVLLELLSEVPVAESSHKNRWWHCLVWFFREKRNEIKNRS